MTGVTPPPSQDGDEATPLRIYRDIAARYGRFLPNHGNMPYALLPFDTLRLRLARQLAHRYRERRVIFCINSGRAGSGYLAHLLSTDKRVTAYHEPRPRMTGGFLRLADCSPLQDSYARRMIKVIGICDHMRRLPSDSIYAETNHMFIKVFHDVVLDSFPRATVVILRRDMAATLKSLVNLGYFSNRSWHWRLWMQARTSHTAVVNPPRPFEELDAVDRAIAYLADIEGRTAQFKTDYPDTPIIEARLEEISQPAGAEKLLRSLDLRVNSEALRGTNARINTRADLKHCPEKQITLEQCKERIHAYVSQIGGADRDLIAPLLADLY